MTSEKTQKAYKEYLRTLGTSGISYKKGKIHKFEFGGDDDEPWGYDAINGGIELGDAYYGKNGEEPIMQFRAPINSIQGTRFINNRVIPSVQQPLIGQNGKFVFSKVDSTNPLEQSFGEQELAGYDQFKEGLSGSPTITWGTDLQKGLGIASAVGNAIGLGVNNAKLSADPEEYRERLGRQNDRYIDSIYDIKDNTGLMTMLDNTDDIDHIGNTTFNNKSAEQDFFGNIGAGVSAAMSMPGGPVTKALTGFGTALSGLVGSFIRKGRADRAARETNEYIDRLNAKRQATRAHVAENVDENNDRLRLMNMFNNNYNAFGGDLHSHGSDFDKGLAFINTGGKHEQNPNEGVMVGVDANGVPNLVEEGEVIWDDYVFSDRLKTPEALKKKYKLGGDLTFAESVKKILKDAIKRPNDPIVEATNKEILTEFMNVQEEMRLDEQEKARQKFIQSRDEDFMNELAMLQGAPQGEMIPQEGFEIPAQQGQEEMMPPGYAFGGHVFKRGGYTPPDRYTEGINNPNLAVRLGMNQMITNELQDILNGGTGVTRWDNTEIFSDENYRGTPGYATGRREGKSDNKRRVAKEQPRTNPYQDVLRKVNGKYYTTDGKAWPNETMAFEHQKNLGLPKNGRIQASVAEQRAMRATNRAGNTPNGVMTTRYGAQTSASAYPVTIDWDYLTDFNIVSSDIKPIQEKWQREYNKLSKRYELNSPAFIRAAKELSDKYNKEIESLVQNRQQEKQRYEVERERSAALFDADKAATQYLMDRGYKRVNNNFWNINSEDVETYRKIRSGELVYKDGSFSKGQKILDNNAERKVHRNAVLNTTINGGLYSTSSGSPFMALQTSNNTEPIEDIVAAAEQVETPEGGVTQTTENPQDNTGGRDGADGKKGGDQTKKGDQTGKSKYLGVRYGSYKEGDAVSNWNTRTRKAVEDYLEDQLEKYESTNDAAEKERIQKETIDQFNKIQNLYAGAYNENAGKSYSRKSAKVGELQTEFNTRGGNKYFGNPNDWININTKTGTGDNQEKGWYDQLWGNQTAIRHFGTLADEANMGRIGELVGQMGIQGSYNLDYGTEGGKLYTLGLAGEQAPSEAQTQTKVQQQEAAGTPQNTKPANATQPQRTTQVTQRPQIPMRSEAGRYAPVIGGLLGTARGLYASPDYSNADAIIAAAQDLGIPVNIPVDTIGDYRVRRPYDERYMVNMANANRAAAARGAENTAGGNRAMQLMGASLLARNNQQELGEIMRQSYLANRADDAQVADFNRGTNIYNMHALNQRNLTQAQLNSHRQQAGFSGLASGYNLRQGIKNDWDESTRQSLNSALTSIGAIGRENADMNVLNSLFNEGYYDVAYDPNGGFKYYARTKMEEPKAKGGKLNRKKRRF